MANVQRSFLEFFLNRGVALEVDAKEMLINLHQYYLNERPGEWLQDFSAMFGFSQFVDGFV